MTKSRYQEAYNKIYKELPKWKQNAVIEDSAKSHWSGILTDFIQKVVELAENETLFNKEVTHNTENSEQKSKKKKTKVKK